MVSQFNHYKIIIPMKHLKKTSGILFIMALFAMQSCHPIRFKTVEGNKNTVCKEIPVSAYSEIQLGTPGEVIYRQMPGESPFLQIEVDENILPLLTVTVEKNCLKIRHERGINIHPSRLIIHTHSAELSKLQNSGSGKIHLTGEVEVENMEISISGLGDIVTDQIHCSALRLSISGLGNVHLTGSGEKASFSISGLGNIHAYEYCAEELTSSVSGLGNVDAHAGKTLNANISGLGNINYKGHPDVVNCKRSGLGSINRVN
jgi:hypothetical protein